MTESTQYQNIDHLTVSLEITPAVAASSADPHPKTSHTMQQISMNQVNTFEEWSITIGAPDSGTFQVNFLNPITAKLWQSDPLAADSSADTLRNRIKSYYTSNFGANIEVSRIMFDAAGVETTDSTLATTFTHTIKLLKAINGFSANAVSIKKVSTVSTFVVVSPNKGGIQSTAPINGTYAITCTDHLGASHTSRDINYNTSPMWVTKAIQESIPFLASKVEAIYDYKYPYYENGVSFILHFTGLHYDQPACSIAPGSGDYPLTGNSPTAETTVIQNYGASIMFEPVHLEFLTSDAQMP